MHFLNKMALQHDQSKMSHRTPLGIEQQRKLIGMHFKQSLKRQNIRYLVGAKWLSQWKAYVGPPPSGVHPGPVDNSDLLQSALVSASTNFSFAKEDSQTMLFCSINAYQLKEHLSEKRDYVHITEEAWNLFVQWYGMTAGSRAIVRGVREHGGNTWLELYPAKLRLFLSPHMSDCTELAFSEVHTIGLLERVMRIVFRIEEDVICRVWCKGTVKSEAFWMVPVSNKTTNLKSVIDSEKIIVIQKRNPRGNWPAAPNLFSQQTSPPMVDPPRVCREVLSILHTTQTPHTSQPSKADHCPSYTEAMPPDSTLVYTEQLVQLQHQLAEAEQKVSDVKDQLAQAQCQALEASKRAEQSEALIRELLDKPPKDAIEVVNFQPKSDAQLTEFQQKLEQAHRQIEETKRQTDQARQQADEARQQAYKAKKQVDQYRQQADESKQQAHQARQQADESIQQAHQARQQADEARQQTDEARQQADEARQQADEARKQADEARQQADEARKQADEARQQAGDAHQRADAMEHDLRDAKLHISKSDQVFQDMLQRLMGHIPQSQPFWVVQREEVTFTDEVVGTGGWGSIKVAIFRGQRVAAKCLHQEIISAHNIRLFTREMNMAAHSRHPNLLQFMGAVMEGSPIILMELLPTSLREVLEQGAQLTRQQIISISCDVARALNYLHLTTPDPIIHRDLSSANILLEPNKDSWKAKLSDYGSVNFVRCITTPGPGNPLYAAPEAGDPNKHSSKMDVFSFGVLLVEMTTGKLPDNCEELIQTQMNDWPEMVRIVRACTRQGPQRRPDMSELITDLTELIVE